jgi:hypothetical protein
MSPSMLTESTHDRPVIDFILEPSAMKAMCIIMMQKPGFHSPFRKKMKSERTMGTNAITVKLTLSNRGGTVGLCLNCDEAPKD